MVTKFIKLLVVFLALAFPAVANAATLSLVPSNGTFNKGCTFQVRVDLDTQGAQTDGTDAVLLFDANKLKLNQFPINNGTIYPDYSNVPDEQNGKVTISGIASIAQAYSGKGTLATVSFEVKPDAVPGSTQVRFQYDANNKNSTTDSNVVERGTVAELLNSVIDGSYTIGTGSGCAGAGSGTSAGSTSAGSGTTGGTSGPGGIYYRAPVGAASGSATYTQADYGVESKGGILPPAGFEVPTIALVLAGGLFIIIGIIGATIF